VLVVLLFATVLWIPVVHFILMQAISKYADYVEDKHNQDWKFVTFAIDIPQTNIQTPKAVEQLFSHLAGGFQSADLRDKFRDGYRQRWFSMEIISIEGYIQFLIWTEEQYRDLVEAAVYAQYPDAEVIEVEDYVSNAPDAYPSMDYDVWAGDFGLTENAAFPIRTYEEFEHSISKDTVLKDPMGTMLESFSRIGHGEQMWLQILVCPVSNSWKEDIIAKIKEYIGEAKPVKSSMTDPFTDNMVTKEATGLLQEFGRQLTGSVFGLGESSGAGESNGSEDKNQLKYMTPGQIKMVEAMEKKIQKIGFKTNMRAVYLARKEVFNPNRGVSALVGSINQFNIPSANSFALLASTKDRKSEVCDKKKTRYIEAYKKRKMNLEVKPFMLNIEELATIWHFPMSHVKTPLLQKATSKLAEPPPGLPVEYMPEPFETHEPIAGLTPVEEKKRIVTDSGDEIVMDDEAYG